MGNTLKGRARTQQHSGAGATTGTTMASFNQPAHAMAAEVGLGYDPDLEEERLTLEALAVDPATRAQQPGGGGGGGPSKSRRPAPLRFIPLGMSGGRSFEGDAGTAALLGEVGGVDALRRMMELFYVKMFADPHLDQFVHTQTDPHAHRLSNWIAEKMDTSNPVWSLERRERSKCPVTRMLQGIGYHTVHDRSSAHAAAWFSPKRKPEVMGQHFKLHDSRNWMRLNFWAARESGLFALSPTFESWYIRFLAHFVRVYEGSAPQFARDSARWSADPKNIAAYKARGNRMPDSLLGKDGRGVPLSAALKDLPRHERDSGSWPYGQAEDE